MLGIVGRNSRFVSVLVALLLFSGPAGVAEQPDDRSFGWYVELVSVDQAAGAVTVRAPFLKHVANYIDEFSPGEEVVIVWTQFEGEADGVIYIERPDVMKTRGGYIVYADFVGADLEGHTMTFTLPLTNEMSSLASAQPGTPVRIESPLQQPDAVTTIASVALNERPPPRPEPVVEEEIVADPDGPLAQIAGDWKIESEIMGNKFALDCALTQSETELSGTCKGPLPDAVPLTGSVEGNTVRFAIASSFSGTEVRLGYTGAVAESGVLMKGDVDLGGMAAGFTGSKQEG